MDMFRTGLLFGAMAGMVTAATVFAQFAAPPANTMQPPEAMSNAERRTALERCDALPIGATKDRCMNELQVNRNAAAQIPPASRLGDGRTGAPGIGTGESSVKQDWPARAGSDSKGARSGP